MVDIFGNLIRPGDVCAISARNGKHDSVIKIFYVTEALKTTHPDYGTSQEFLRGLDGAGRLTQIQKASNVVVINHAVPFDHPRLAEIRKALEPERLEALRQRLAGAGNPPVS